MTTIDTTPPALPIDPIDQAPSSWSRWSDRLNPILVREVQQAVKGRVFLITVLVALAISVVIAIITAGDYRARDTGGRNAFDAGLAVLAPLLLFVVPMQAYQSMRMELRVGIVEQLLLSHLRPRRIVLGKLAAAMVQFGLYVSVMAPLLATSYLLRGVDLPTIALCLGFAFVFCVGATAAAISAAAQGALPAMQALANLAVAAGLGIASFGMMGYIGSGECVRDLGRLLRSPEFGMVTSLIGLGSLAGIVLSSLVAQSFLCHAFENRSTPFRVFLFAVAGLAYGWMFLFVDSRHYAEAVGVVTFFAALLGTVFGVFLVTEQRDLSPRVRAHVPASSALALLSAPFLPGRNRGLLCMVVFFGMIVAISAPSWVVGLPRPYDMLRMMVMVVSYAVLYLSIGRWLRGRLPTAVLGNHMARIGLPLVLFLGCVLPLLLDVFVQGGPRGWHVGHAMNPFWTISKFAFSAREQRVTIGLAIVAAVVLLLQLPALIGGVREVLNAAAERRARRTAPEPSVPA